MATSSIPHSSGIYKITCAANGKIYVGGSVNLRVRWRQHRNALRKGIHRNQYLQRAWDKHGEAHFVFEVLELVMPWAVVDRENHWLETLKPYDRKVGFNIGQRAENGMADREHTAEARRKIAMSLVGHPVNAETRSKLREAAQGYKHSQETKTKISNTLMGRKKSIQAAANSGMARAKTWIVTSPDGREIIIQSLSRFCVEQGLDQRNMWAVANGKQKQHRGWKCRYA